jgi:hypothetical protein
VADLTLSLDDTLFDALSMRKGVLPSDCDEIYTGESDAAVEWCTDTNSIFRSCLLLAMDDKILTKNYLELSFDSVSPFLFVESSS